MNLLAKGILVAILLACLVAIALRRTRAATDSSGWVTSKKGDLPGLDQLRTAGADLSKPTEFNYYLYFPDSVTAARAANSVRELKWEAEVRSGRGRTEWLCLATNTIVPEQSAILEATKRFTALTTSLGGRYDGWEAQITP